MNSNRKSLFSVILPGILVAATGVGAGDLMTAGLAGSAIGVSLLWAVVIGAVLKWFLNEGIARWQMATGTTLLEGWSTQLGGWIQWIFMFYLLCWTFFTGGALITACGVAGAGLIPLSNDPVISKIIWGIVHSFVGLLIVFVGGFRFFVKIMSACIALMFFTVIFTAIMAKPDWNAVGYGLVRPVIPESGLGWIIGILGGVGGTVTLLSYGYWIREDNRAGIDGIKTCRLDLSVGYIMTALFGIAMVIIGSKVRITGSGADTAPLLADQLRQVIGPAGKWIFLIGFWGAVFSSLLGVWQSVPYLFTDFIFLRRGLSREERQAIDYTVTVPYRVYLCAIALIPLPVLLMTVTKAQLTYAVLGSLFMPLLALTLLIMNNRERWVGKQFLNGYITNAELVVTLAFFAYIGFTQIFDKLKLLIGS
ncbi:Nramp family divalent metal transporter [Candidatus Latescibacterota bacterium]